MHFFLSMQLALLLSRTAQDRYRPGLDVGDRRYFTLNFHFFTLKISFLFYRISL